MNRVEQLRQVIDEIVRLNPNQEESRCGFEHLYGVSAVCTLLAHRRGLDPELCSAAGMLHDIWNYKFSDCEEHGELGAVEAGKILADLGTFSPGEIRMICGAIARHSHKESVEGEMAKLLKDADIFQHYLYNPALFIQAAAQHFERETPANPVRIRRLVRVMAELGFLEGEYETLEQTILSNAQ